MVESGTAHFSLVSSVSTFKLKKCIFIKKLLILKAGEGAPRLDATPAIYVSAYFIVFVIHHFGITGLVLSFCHYASLNLFLNGLGLGYLLYFILLVQAPCRLQSTPIKKGAK